MKHEAFIWWLNQDQAQQVEVILDHQIAATNAVQVPAYIYDEFLSLLGRNGRGRLWVSDHIHKTLNRSSMDIPPYLIDASPVLRFINQSGGIVILAKDLPYVLGLGGFVTTYSEVLPIGAEIIYKYTRQR
jgi:hypothetical protein